MLLRDLGCGLYRYRWPVLAAWALLLLVALPVAPNVVRALVAGGFTSADLEAARAGAVLSSRFGSFPESLYLVYRDPTGRTLATEPQFLAWIDESLANVGSVPAVERVVLPSQARARSHRPAGGVRDPGAALRRD